MQKVQRQRCIRSSMQATQPCISPQIDENMAIITILVRASHRKQLQFWHFHSRGHDAIIHLQHHLSHLAQILKSAKSWRLAALRRNTQWCTTSHVFYDSLPYGLLNLASNACKVLSLCLQYGFSHMRLATCAHHPSMQIAVVYKFLHLAVMALSLKKHAPPIHGCVTQALAIFLCDPASRCSL